MSKSSKEQQNEVAAEVKQTAVATLGMDFAADAGAGMEGTTQDSFAIPFLSVLQANSPQVTQGDAKYMPEARPGMLLNTVSGTLYDGQKGALFVPAAYRRAFLQWGPRQGENAGFRGEHRPEEIEKMRAERRIVEMEGRLYAPLEDGSVNPKRSPTFRDTRMHYGMLLSDDTQADFMPVLLSLTSTQIKKSKQLMSALTAVKVTLSDGRKITPPTFANVVRVTTVPESNDQGNWFGVRFTVEGQVANADLYQAAKEFHGNVLKGSVNVNHEAAADAGAASTEGGGF